LVFFGGDDNRECGGLCLPLAAAGCMHPEGYLRQQIGSDGWQENPVASINCEAALLILTLKARSFGPGHSKIAMPKTYDVE